jgi:hypothetical protein
VELDVFWCYYVCVVIFELCCCALCVDECCYILWVMCRHVAEVLEEDVQIITQRRRSLAGILRYSCTTPSEHYHHTSLNSTQSTHSLSILHFLSPRISPYLPLFLSPYHFLTLSLTLSLSHSHTLARSLTLTHTLSHSLSLTLSHYLTHSLSLSLSVSLSLSQSLTFVLSCTNTTA